MGFGGMLGLLRVNSLPQQTSAEDRHAIIDDRRRLVGVVTLGVSATVLDEGCGLGDSGRILCGGKSAGAVGAHWPNSHAFRYPG